MVLFQASGPGTLVLASQFSIEDNFPKECKRVESVEGEFVLRDGKELTVPLTLGERPREP